MTAIERAADLAIHQLQLNSAEAVKFVEREVPGTDRGVVLAALVDSMVFHKAGKK